MKRYYVMDTENPYCTIEDWYCYTSDIDKYIASHNISVAKNVREVSKEEYTRLKKTGHRVTYKR